MELKKKIKLIIIITKIDMKNWKTTVSGLLGALPTILGLFGVVFPPEVEKGALALGVYLIGVFSKDKNVTGGTIAQTSEATTRTK